MIKDLLNDLNIVAGEIMQHIAIKSLIFCRAKKWKWGSSDICSFGKTSKMSRIPTIGITVYHRVLIFFLTIVLFAVATGTSLAANYYIATNGSDSNPGTINSPWRNPWIIATKTFSPGDVIYIRGGSYTITSQSWTRYNCPTIHVRQNGTAQNPITIRSYPGETVSLQHDSLNPIIGQCKSYRVGNILIDGFNIPGAGVSIEGGNNITVQNNSISGISCNFCDNCTSIWIQDAQNITIKNNRIDDVYNSCRDANATGITAYFNNGVTIENNQISNAPAGIHPKGYNDNFTIRNNYLHNLSQYAYGVSFASGDVITGIKIYNNIFANTGSGMKMHSGGDAGPNNNYNVYNNTIYGYTGECLSGPEYSGSTNFKAYNNICVRTGSATREMLIYTGTQGSIATLDYNLYYRTTGLSFASGSNTYTSLSSWRTATSKEAGSIGGTTSGIDPLFVGPLTTAAGFKLQAGSPAKNAGRAGGTSGGTAVDIGAYATGNECIGLCSSTPSVSPGNPFGLQ